MRLLIITFVLVVGLLVVGLLVSVKAPAEPVTYTGTLEPGDMMFQDTDEYYDLYEIELKAGQFIDLYLSSDAFDTYLLMVTPDGEEISIDDYYTDDTNAGLLFIARQSGAYTFYVSSHTSGETGDYEFTCEAIDSELEETFEGELAAGDEVSWKGGEYFDRYEIQLEPNEKRVLAMDSDDFAVYLSIHQPDGFVDFVYGYPAADIIEADETGGTYVLIVTSKESKEVGAYTLEVRSLEEQE